MKRKILFALSMLFSSAAAADDIPDMSLRYSMHVPEGFYLSKIDKAFSENVTEKSGGKIKFQLFWANALGGEAEMAQLVSSGAVDLATIVPGNNPSLLPLTSVTNAVPMVFFDGPSVVEATRKLYYGNAAAVAELEKANLKPFLIRHLPEYRLLCNSPVSTLEELKGKKIRTYGNYVPKMFVALGAVPVNVMVPELNEALQRGTVDCIYLTYSAFDLLKLYKSGKYLIDVNFGTINAYSVFTAKSTWDGWPESVRSVMTEAAAEAEKMALELNETAEKSALDRMLADGAELVHFKDQDALPKAMPDMLEVWVGDMKEAGKGDEAAEIAALLRNMK